MGEFRHLFERPGEFLLIQGEEITDKFESKPIHMNASNVLEVIKPQGGTSVVDVMDRPVIMLTMRGASTGAVRKVPVMRVERDGRFLAVASKGGAPEHPAWYFNLQKNPDVEVMVGTESFPARARELEGKERFDWWVAAVEDYPPYAEYQKKTDRVIPVLLLEPTS